MSDGKEEPEWRMNSAFIGVCIFIIAAMFVVLIMAPMLLGLPEEHTVTAKVIDKRLIDDGVYYYTDNLSAPLYTGLGSLWPSVIERNCTYTFTYINQTNDGTAVYRITGAVQIS